MSFGSFIKKQFIDVIQWNEDVDGVLAWRFPMQDFEIQNGGILIVRESQMAVFVNEGQVADVFGPGTHKLTTQTLPRLHRLARRGQRAAVAQIVALLAADVVDGRIDLLPTRVGGGAGERRQAGRPAPGQERTAVHQRITRRQSSSNTRTSDCVFSRFGGISMRCISGGKLNISRVVSAFR